MENQILYRVSRNESFKQDSHNLSLNNFQMVNLLNTDEETIKPCEKMFYFHEPKWRAYPLDLGKDIDLIKRRTGRLVRPNLDVMEFHSMKNQQVLQESNDRINICTEEDVLFRIMLTPLYQRNNWHIRATKVGEVIYLANNQKRWKIFDNKTYLNRKIHQYCFSDSPSTAPDPDAPINANERLNGVYSAQLQNIDLHYSAHIDGIFSDTPILDLTKMDELGKCRYVAVKTFSPQLAPIATKSLRDAKFTKCYLQGIKDLYFAAEDVNFVVNSPIERTAVNESVEIKAGLRFLHTILMEIFSVMSTVQSSSTVYEFKYNSNQHYIQYEIHHGQSEYNFLSEKFVEYMEKI